MTTPTAVTTAFIVVDYLIKIIAIGFVPENRRPSSGQAWLLAILFVPIIGLPLFLLIGSPYVRGRRHKLQQEANRAIAEYTAHHPVVPETHRMNATAGGVLTLNRNLTSMPCVLGVNEGLHPDSVAGIKAIAAAIDQAERYVHLEMYILAMDQTTAPLFDAMTAAVKRGVKVRVLYDHLGSRKYPGRKEMDRRLTADGIDWHLMMPIDLLHRRWRRPDLRNHRKLVVIDGIRGFMGSQNMIDPSYLSPKNVKIGRAWVDLNIEITGEIVESLDVVFATDWFAETGERLVQAKTGTIGGEIATDAHPEHYQSAGGSTAFQLVPSGPGFPTEPNLRMFTSLIHLAQRTVSIVSPYFVPDEALFSAITTASYRGVQLELYVSEKADQFMVHHAQRSYYQQLLEAGVRIYRYPAPAVLHTKMVTVDDQVGVIGSSNMDMRSFALDYEIMLLGLGEEVAASLNEVIADYRAKSTELTLEQWKRRSLVQRYLDNAMRLTSALQ
ncbi:cardiolipin synthase [Microlunatus elymi]|nr:cardiolipin synthase [Microlunatus elymi]